MAIVGHFKDLTEAQKLVQSVLLQGVVQEIYEEGQLLQKLPVMVINSKSIIYNRQESRPTADHYAIHEEIPFTADVEYATQVEVELKRAAMSRILDNFMLKTYKDPNDYKTQILSECRAGCQYTIEDMLIYGDTATYVKQPNGLDKLCSATGTNAFVDGDQDHDMGGAAASLTTAIARECIDACKPRPNILLMTRTLRNVLSARAFELGVSTALPIGSISYGKDEYGRRIEYFDGVPIMVSDYLAAENDDTGGKAATATGIVSMYAIRFGQITDGGLCLCVGGDTGGVEFFHMIELAELENYDAAGIRLVAYYNLALGSTKAISRVHSIDEDGPVDA